MGLKRTLFSAALFTTATLGLLVASAEMLLPVAQRPSNLPKMIALYRYRLQHPHADSKDLKKVFDTADGGFAGLLSQMEYKPKKSKPTSAELGETDENNQESDEPAKPKIPVAADHKAIDQNKINYIKNMMIPDEMKNQILESYLRTGVMLDLTPKTQSADAASTAPEPDSAKK
jgi:hypothetical protein